MFGKFHILRSLILLLILCRGLDADDWRTFEDTKGRKLEAKVMSVLGEQARVLRKSDRRIVSLPFSMLVEADESTSGTGNPNRFNRLPLGSPSRKWTRMRFRDVYILVPKWILSQRSGDRKT